MRAPLDPLFPTDKLTVNRRRWLKGCAERANGACLGCRSRITPGSNPATRRGRPGCGTACRDVHPWCQTGCDIRPTKVRVDVLGRGREDKKGRPPALRHDQRQSVRTADPPDPFSIAPDKRPHPRVSPKTRRDATAPHAPRHKRVVVMDRYRLKQSKDRAARVPQFIRQADEN